MPATRIEPLDPAPPTPRSGDWRLHLGRLHQSGMPAIL
jgi:hypothetical protein